MFASGRRLYATGVGAAAPPPAPPPRAGRVECVVERSRPFKDGWLVKFREVADRAEADRWRGVTLSAPLAELRPPEGNELYLHELAGMRVRDERLGEIGAVASWYEIPQGLVLEVRGDGRAADVPFNEAFVVRVDRDARTLDVRLPDGMVE